MSMQIDSVLPPHVHPFARPEEAAAVKSGSRFLLLISFLIGVLHPVTVESLGLKLGGQIYVGEVLLAFYAGWSLLVNIGNPHYFEKRLRLALLALVLTLLGYVVSDPINQSSTINLVRGWARMGFVAADVIGLNAMCRKYPTRIIFFLIGLAVGFVLTAGSSVFDLYYYKLNLGVPLTIVVLCLLPAIPIRARYLVTALLWMLMGIVHLFLDYRSLGGMCLLGGAIMLAKVLAARRFRAVYAFVLAAGVAIASAGIVYSLAASAGEFGGRRMESNSNRIATAAAAWYGIVRSPIIGNGSWAVNSETDMVKSAILAEMSGKRLKIEAGVPGHSELLQAWYEAGLLGLAFFLYTFIAAIKTARDAVLQPQFDLLYPVTLQFALFAIYNFFLSPFGGTARFFLAATVVLYLIQQRRIRAREAYRQAWTQVPAAVPA